MTEYAAFLRGVMPTNAKMPELRAAFEAAGFGNVRTLLSSGNVVFSARTASAAALERRAEAAMQKRLGRSFLTMVRSLETLRDILASDPYGRFDLAPGSKRVVTFLRQPMAATPILPVSLGKARILSMADTEAFTVYVPDPPGPDFMRLIESTFGKEQTTRSWDTVVKVCRETA
jgi:uncharacterized protein (DUF1697 family)